MPLSSLKVAGGTITAADINELATGVLLTSVYYRPATSPDRSTTTSTTFVDVNAALTVTFTVPASGKALIKAGGYVFKDTGSTSSATYIWNLRQGSSDVANSDMRMFGSQSTGAASAIGTTFNLTGLTPGASVTYKLGHRVTADTFGLLHTNTFGLAFMEVWSA